MRTMRKFLAIVLTFCMVLGITSVATIAEDSQGYSFKISMSVAEGTTAPEHFGVEYRVLDGSKQPVDGTNYNGHLEGVGTLNVTVDMPDSYFIEFIVQNAGRGLKLGDADITNEDWTASHIISVAQLQNEYNFQLFNQQSNNNPPASQDNPPAPQGNTEATINYSYEGTRMDIVVNKSWANPSGEASEENGSFSTTVKFDANENDATVEIQLGILFVLSMNKIEINGIDYSNYIPKTKSELVEAFDSQHTWVTLSVPRNIVDSKEIYNISTKSVDDGNIAVGNFLWTYDENNKYILRPDGTPDTDENGSPKLNDDFINHGRLELISIEYNGQVYDKAALATKLIPGSAFDWELEENPNELVHGATIPAGSKVTVKLIPEYGYQLVNFSINGGTFETGKEQSTFTFEIKPGNFHLGADFEKVEDCIQTNSKVVTDGKIEISDKEIDTGSVVLEVKDAEVSDAQKEAFANAGSDGYQVSDYFDIDLYQVIYKGTPDDVWMNALGKENNLNDPAVITLYVGDIDGTEVSILHEKHDGTYEELKAEYDPVNKTVKFSTNGFSKYALAVRGGDIPTSADSAKRYIIPMGFAIIAIIGTTVIFKKKALV